MNTLNAVSETALITLQSRVIEAEQNQPVIRDDMARMCLARLHKRLPAGIRARVLDRKLPASLTRHIALRARKYDAYARDFMATQPDGLVVSLGAGFDTRYWRVSKQPWPYVEVDLPAVIEAKKAVFGDLITYPMLACSVLDYRWMAEVQAMPHKKILFLAEGLLMYLPRTEVIALLRTLSERFAHSTIVFEVVHERYTRGLWKKSVEAKMRRNLGSEAGVSYQFGLRDAREVESFSPQLTVEEEWSYFEDDDIKPRFLRLFQHLKFMTRTQWTIKVRCA